MSKASLPIPLSHNAVIQISFPVIHIQGILCMAEQKICQPHHVVYRTVLLVLIPQSVGQMHLRTPYLTAGLSTCCIGSSLGDCHFPIGFYNFQPFFFSCHLIGRRCPQDLGNRSVGMHIGQHIFSFQKAVKQITAVIPLHQFPEHTLLCDLIQQNPYLQHSAGLHI